MVVRRRRWGSRHGHGESSIFHRLPAVTVGSLRSRFAHLTRVVFTGAQMKAALVRMLPQLAAGDRGTGVARSRNAKRNFLCETHYSFLPSLVLCSGNTSILRPAGPCELRQVGGFCLSTGAGGAASKLQEPISQLRSRGCGQTAF